MDAALIAAGAAPPIAFAAPGLDRADHIRSNPAALAALMDRRGRLLRLDGVDPVIGAAGDLAWGSLADAPGDAELVFLGLDDAGRAAFATVPADAAPPAYAGPQLWAAMATLSPGELAIYGAARALTSWHARHRFCARCGGGTRIAKGGWQRQCTGCDTEHFPRVDPVVIMTVEHDGALLLGRQPRFPPMRYSALAGFVEPGEAIEAAVQREVWEEAGLHVRDVRYVASQPWPFPHSLMIACHAFADSGELTIDGNELEDARWFTRAQVAQAMRAGATDAAFVAPPPHAVAWHLLDRWLAAG